VVGGVKAFVVKSGLDRTNLWTWLVEGGVLRWVVIFTCGGKVLAIW
jgi:hypothetical protein